MRVVDVTVSVPRERLGEFYALLGRFFGSSESAEDASRVSSEAPAGQEASAPAVGRVTGRYAPLYEHLLRTQGNRLEMSFGEVERVLGKELSTSSRKYRENWANSEGNYFGQSWLRAGWKVAAVDLRMERVRFERH